MKLLLLRHGQTAGNLQKRYIGITDEPLCQEGIDQLSALHLPEFEVIVSSPLKRCIQTAVHLFPNRKIHTVSGFRECDFGDFEGKNYAELNGDPRYQEWIDSGGTVCFPNGEEPEAFQKRSCNAFIETVAQFKACDSIAMIVHGGTIMSILSRFAVPHRDYYGWMCDNGHGWLCECTNLTIHIQEKL